MFVDDETSCESVQSSQFSSVIALLTALCYKPLLGGFLKVTERKSIHWFLDQYYKTYSKASV